MLKGFTYVGGIPEHLIKRAHLDVSATVPSAAATCFECFAGMLFKLCTAVLYVSADLCTMCRAGWRCMCTKTGLPAKLLGSEQAHQPVEATLAGVPVHLSVHVNRGSHRPADRRCVLLLLAM
jgi:hypothetical protein